MKGFIVSSAFAAVLCSASAFAQQPPPRSASSWEAAPANEPAGATIGNGLQLNLDILGAGGVISVASAASGTATAPVAAGSTSDLGIGYYFDQNSLLLDIGFEATSGTNIFFGVSPAYRRYFAPLKVSAVSPFAEASILFGIAAPSGAPAAFAFGLGGGAGAEWMFTKSMGLEGLISLSYTHENNGANFNVDAIGFAGRVGLTIHI